MTNVLLVAERRSVLPRSESDRFLSRLYSLPILTDTDPFPERGARILALARSHALSSYVATDLELAHRLGAALASIDRELNRASSSLGGALYPESLPSFARAPCLHFPSAATLPAMTPSPAAPDSAQVRSQLVTALELELIGPSQRVLRALGADGEGLATEALDRLPSSWYSTGFLVPSETDLSLKCDDTADDDLAGLDGVDQHKPSRANADYKPGSGDDGGSSESGPAKPQLFPSSIGVSVLVPPGGELQLIARWGDYVRLAQDANPDAAGSAAREEAGSPEPWREQQIWQRRPRQEALALSYSEITGSKSLTRRPWPNSNGLHLRWHCRPAPASQGYAAGTVAVTLFLTNERKKALTLVERDQQSAFQAELELRCAQGFVARLDPHAGRASGDWDEAVNALQFRDAREYGVGHNVGVELENVAYGACERLRNTLIPQASV